MHPIFFSFSFSQGVFTQQAKLGKLSSFLASFYDHKKLPSIWFLRAELALSDVIFIVCTLTGNSYEQEFWQLLQKERIAQISVILSVLFITFSLVLKVKNNDKKFWQTFSH